MLEESVNITNSNATSTKWLFELDETKEIEGAGLYVFSSKRREIADIKLEELTVQVNDLAALLSSGGAAGGLVGGEYFDVQSVLADLQKQVDVLRNDLQDLRDNFAATNAGSTTGSAAAAVAAAADSNGIDFSSKT